MRPPLVTLLALLAAVGARSSTVPSSHTDTTRTTGHQLASLLQGHASNTTLDDTSAKTDYYCIIGFDHEQIMAVYFHANEVNPQTIFSWKAGLCSTTYNPSDWSASIAIITLKDDTSKSAMKRDRKYQSEVKRDDVSTACITGFSADEIMEYIPLSRVRALLTILQGCQLYKWNYRCWCSIGGR